MPARQKAELDKLHATAETRQRNKYLERYFIESASISGIGSGRKAVLRSFGIETAADIDRYKIRAIQGFGDVLTNTIVDWKKSCERGFVFNPRETVSQADKNAVLAKIAARKRTIEVALSNGTQELQRFRQEASNKTNTLLSLLNTALKNLAQARADLSLLS